MMNARSAKERQGGEGDHHRQLSVDRPVQGLDDRVVDDCLIPHPAIDVGIFADPVEDHDGVMNGETDDGQQGGQEE